MPHNLHNITSSRYNLYVLLSFVHMCFTAESKDEHCKPAKAINAAVCGISSCCILNKNDLVIM